jgi:hypothetical protein
MAGKLCGIWIVYAMQQQYIRETSIARSIDTVVTQSFSSVREKLRNTFANDAPDVTRLLRTKLHAKSTHIRAQDHMDEAATHDALAKQFSKAQPLVVPLLLSELSYEVENWGADAKRMVQH